MRVLLVNKFYYPRGGDCIVVLNTQSLLRGNGIEAEVFAMRYPDNLPARYQDHFASEVNFGGSPGDKLRALRRTLGLDRDVVQNFQAVLDDYKPDVVHLHNIHSYLSPVVGLLAHKRGIRVVWTLHDYKLLCPRYDCLLDGKPCEQCITGNTQGVIAHRCMKGSLAASFVARFESIKWNRNVLKQNTDLFICPSQFMAQMMERGGFDPNKMVVLNNFLDPVKYERYQSGGNTTREDYYCFVGRLSPEKGIEDLLEVASRLPYRLKVAGGGPLESAMRIKYADCSNIEFLGMIDAVQVANLLAGARLSVTPSQWYENNPLSVVESLCAGTPVAGSQIGGIPELIDNSNGIIFQPFDKEALSTAITTAMSREWDHSGIAAKALKRFSPEAHLQVLTNDIYRI